VLPDDVLVEIYNFYIQLHFPRNRNTWHALVHVCRRWRSLVFASPRRLNIRLEYRGHQPMLQALDPWPILPVILTSSLTAPFFDQWWDNTVAALESEHYNRICEIYIDDMTNSRWDRFAAAMQKPFPELTHLRVWICRSVVPILPDSFLGRSAPRLRQLILRSAPFPSIPKLLLSASGLVMLSLTDIPDSGYFSPNAMATALTAMTRLEILDLLFRSPRSRPDPASRLLLSPTRLVLPALTRLRFRGVYVYLEDLLTRIDAPLLHYLSITFFMDLNFDLPQLHRLIGHTQVFRAYNHADVYISAPSIQLSLYPKTVVANHRSLRNLRININIHCRELDQQLSSLAQVCSSSFPLIPTLEELKIRQYGIFPSSHSGDDSQNTQWLEFLHPFTALKNLYLTDQIARRVCGALQELSGERATAVLPALRNLFVRWLLLETLQEAMMPFVTARQLSGLPMVVDRWDD